MSDITAKIEKPKTVTNPQTDAAARERLVIARMAMLRKMPFLGNLATRLHLTNCDQWCSTAATDGRHLYYNSEFIMKLKEKEVIFLVGHEVLHVVYAHIGIFGRRDWRDPTIWNIAADYAINRDLLQDKVGEFITSVPCLYDKKYDGMSSEEIYEDIMKNAKKIDIDSLAKKLLDEHMGEGEGDGQEGDSEGSGRPKGLSESEKRALGDEIKEAILAAAQASGVGNVPAGIRQYIDALTDPKVDWRDVIHNAAESQLKSDFTYMKPSRRGWSCDAILPSMMREPTIEITVAIDMSGSIGQKERTDFMTEVKGICDQYGDYKITLLTWDTKTYYIGHFTADDGFEALLEAELVGGGGTSPGCIWDWCEENDHEPKQLLIFTDFYIDGSANDRDEFDTIWLSYKNKAAVAPHGTLVHYD